MNRCPECGAESYPNHGHYSDFKCGSHHTYDGFRQTARCLISKLEAENAELRRKVRPMDEELRAACDRLRRFHAARDADDIEAMDAVYDAKGVDPDNFDNIWEDCDILARAYLAEHPEEATDAAKE